LEEEGRMIIEDLGVEIDRLSYKIVIHKEVIDSLRGY